MRFVEGTFVVLACLLALASSVEAQEECEGGRIATVYTSGRCCWPEQTWSDPLGRCVGAPACPAGTGGEGDDCIPIDPVAAEVAAPTPAPVTPTAPTPAEAAETIDLGSWPSSASAPSGAFNPRMGRGPRRGLVRSGAVLFGLGYGVSIAGAVAGFTYGGRGESCHDTAGTLSLVPIVGALLAAISISNCSYPYYNYTGELEGYRGADNALHVTFGIIASVFEITGFALLVSGLFHTKPRIEYADSGFDSSDRGVHVAFHPLTLPGGGGLGVTVTH